MLLKNPMETTMKRFVQIACASILIAHLSALTVLSFLGPFDGKTFKGRIAFSSDGNYNDEDDWGAFPVAIAILDAFGVTNSWYTSITTTSWPKTIHAFIEK